MERNIKNSGGKIIGTVTINSNEIIIANKTKPELKITNNKIISHIKNKEGIDNNIIIELYDDYVLTIGEIASLFDVPYSKINKIIKNLPVKTTKKFGRRNSSYCKKFSETRIKNISNGLRTFYTTHDNPKKGITLSEEYRKRISNTLKKKYATGELIQDPDKKRLPWLKGRYKEVDFKHGIAGFLWSNKNNQRFLFRSLLELQYFIILEEDDTIFKYKYEPFKIVCDNNSLYTPDFLLNDKIVIELKSRKYIQNIAGLMEQFLYKTEQATKYCNKNNLEFKVVWDEDIGFKTEKMKLKIKTNPELVKKYQIEFFEPKRVGL